MNRAIKIALGVFGLLVIVYFGAAWFFSGLVIRSPGPTLDEDRALFGVPTDYGLPEPEEAVIDLGDIQLAAWYFDNPADQGCGVVFMHGHGGSRYQVLGWLPLFWDRGCDIVTYDRRGRGASTPAFYTYGFYDKEDTLAVRNWFAERADLEPSQIALAGVSYGAATALQAAPLMPEAPFVLADSSYSSMRDIITKQADDQFRFLGRVLAPAALWISGLRAGFDVDAVSPATDVARSNVPVLLMHSRTDEFTPYTQSEAIYDNSDQSRTVIHVNDWGAPHGADVFTDFAAYQSLFDAFVDEYAPGYGTSAIR